MTRKGYSLPKDSYKHVYVRCFKQRGSDCVAVELKKRFLKCSFPVAVPVERIIQQVAEKCGPWPYGTDIHITSTSGVLLGYFTSESRSRVAESTEAALV